MSRDSTTSQPQVVPTNATAVPTNATIAPTNATVAPTNATVAPTNATIAPTNATEAPTTATSAPTTTTTGNPIPPQPATNPLEIGENGKYLLGGILGLAAFAGLVALWMRKNDGRQVGVAPAPIELADMQDNIDAMLSAYGDNGITLPNFARATEEEGQAVPQFSEGLLKGHIDRRFSHPASALTSGASAEDIARLKKAEEIAAKSMAKLQGPPCNLGTHLYGRVSGRGSVVLEIERDFPGNSANVMRTIRNIISLQAVATAWNELSSGTVVDSDDGIEATATKISDAIGSNIFAIKDAAISLAEKLSPEGQNVAVKNILESRFRPDQVAVNVGAEAPSTSVTSADTTRTATKGCTIL